MKRYLAIAATSALAVSVLLPAAAFAEADVFAPEQPIEVAAVSDAAQSLAASAGGSTPIHRDTFEVEILKPASLPPISGLLTVWPCIAQVNDGFGDRDGGFHYGIDIMCPHGTTLVAAAPGLVSEVEDSSGGWGQYVKIDHGSGVSTLYSHMISGSPTVEVGQLVAAGEVIGLTGATGRVTAPHLHFEVWVDGTRVDPRPWLP